MAAVYVKQGFAFRAGNNFPAAFEALRRAYPITQKLAADQKDDPKAQDTFAGVCFAMAQCLGDMGDVAGALENYRKSATIREAITGGSPAFRVGVQTRLAGVYGYMAGVEHLKGDLDAAITLQGRMASWFRRSRPTHRMPDSSNSCWKTNIGPDITWRRRAFRRRRCLTFRPRSQDTER